jgi:hypothetical protein
MGKEGRKHIYQAASSGRGNMGDFFQPGNQGNSHTRLLNERGVSYSFFGSFVALHVFVSADVQIFIGQPSCSAQSILAATLMFVPCFLLSRRKQTTNINSSEKLRAPP